MPFINPGPTPPIAGPVSPWQEISGVVSLSSPETIDLNTGVYPLKVNGSPGSLGQVLISGGPSSPAAWGASPTSPLSIGESILGGSISGGRVLYTGYGPTLQESPDLVFTTGPSTLSVYGDVNLGASGSNTLRVTAQVKSPLYFNPDEAALIEPAPPSSSVGASMTLSSGYGSSGAGGELRLLGNNGTAGGGSVKISGGSTDYHGNGNGGSVTISGGAAEGSDRSGGNVIIAGGQYGGDTAKYGGSVIVVAGGGSTYPDYAGTIEIGTQAASDIYSNYTKEINLGKNNIITNIKGKLNLLSELQSSSSPGDYGQVLTSQGSNSVPLWSSPLSNNAWGSFSDSNTTLVVTGGTEYQIPISDPPAETPVGMSLVSNNIQFSTSGVYSVTASIQLTNKDNTERQSWVWIKKNGLSVDSSASMVSIHRKPGGAGTYGGYVLAVNYVMSFAVNDTLGFFFTAETGANGVVSASTLPAGTPSVVPASPAIIVTAVKVR